MSWVFRIGGVLSFVVATSGLLTGCESAPVDGSSALRSQRTEAVPFGVPIRARGLSSAEAASAGSLHTLLYLRRAGGAIRAEDIEEFSYEQGGMTFALRGGELAARLAACPESVRAFVKTSALEELAFCNDPILPGAVTLFKVKLKSGSELSATGAQADFEETGLRLAAFTVAF
jgi:hypothetical protein